MNEKVKGLIIMGITYILAFSAFTIIFLALAKYTTMNHLLAVLIGDVIATIIVYISGVIFKTASMYDPYWSIQTVIIFSVLVIYYQNFNIGTLIAFITILIYSIRLTVNFLLGFHSLSYVDWRYKMLKEKSGSLFQVVNLLGICMFPTLVVYSASIPMFIYAERGVFSWGMLIGVLIVLVGTGLELITDMQMKEFIKNRKDRSEVINIGLWKYSRHPNYLGEILIWFGVALMVIINDWSIWHWFMGAVINLLMFLFISIPMEENHMKEYKPDFEEYRRSTSPLLILPKRKRKD